MEEGFTKRFIGIAVGVLLAFATTGCRTAVEKQFEPVKPTAWRALFDGHHTNGWQMTGAGYFKLLDGEMVSVGGMGLFWYAPEQFSNCQIRVVFQPTRAHDNSGVFIRVPAPPADPWYAVNNGYEVQIDNTGDLWHRTGCLYSVTPAQAFVNAKAGEWNTLLITLDGPRTMVEVNDRLVTDYTEGTPVPQKKQWYEPERGRRPEAGYIGLQNHDTNTHVHFKEVSVRALR